MNDTDKKDVKREAQLLDVYVRARAVIDYMDRNSGACTGQLLNDLRRVLADFDELEIPVFLRRTKPKESNDGLEDLV